MTVYRKAKLYRRQNGWHSGPVPANQNVRVGNARVAANSHYLIRRKYKYLGPCCWQKHLYSENILSRLFQTSLFLICNLHLSWLSHLIVHWSPRSTKESYVIHQIPTSTTTTTTTIIWFTLTLPAARPLETPAVSALPRPSAPAARRTPFTAPATRRRMRTLFPVPDAHAVCFPFLQSIKDRIPRC